MTEPTKKSILRKCCILPPGLRSAHPIALPLNSVSGSAHQKTRLTSTPGFKSALDELIEEKMRSTQVHFRRYCRSIGTTLCESESCCSETKVSPADKLAKTLLVLERLETKIIESRLIENVSCSNLTRNQNSVEVLFTKRPKISDVSAYVGRRYSKSNLLLRAENQLDIKLARYLFMSYQKRPFQTVSECCVAVRRLILSTAAENATKHALYYLSSLGDPIRWLSLVPDEQLRSELGLMFSEIIGALLQCIHLPKINTSDP